MITADGTYDIDIDAYHSDPKLCDGPSISSSGLRSLLLECPAKYWATSPYNPNRFPVETSKALDIGRAAHCLVLGEPEFNKHFIVSPYDDFRKKEAQEWRDEQTRTVLKKADFDMVTILAAAQKRSAQCMRAFENGKPEKSLIWKDKETGIWLRARPDWLPNDPRAGFVVEFKSALTIAPRQWSSAAFTYGYHLQAAMQVDGVAEVMGVKPLGVAHCVQEKDPPYLAELRLFGPEQIDWGRKQYRKGLHIFADCLSSGNWPGFTSEPSFIETPYWVAKQMEEGWSDNFTKGASNGNAGSYTSADYLRAG